MTQLSARRCASTIKSGVPSRSWTWANWGPGSDAAVGRSGPHPASALRVMMQVIARRRMGHLRWGKKEPLRPLPVAPAAGTAAAQKLSDREHHAENRCRPGAEREPGAERGEAMVFQVPHV